MDKIIPIDCWLVFTEFHYLVADLGYFFILFVFECDIAGL